MMSNEEKELRNKLVSEQWCDKNIFVEAGAGAGKTTIIVSRVVNQLKWGKINPEELVVITFTKKAAAELYDRISKGIEGELRKGGLNKDEEEKLKNAQQSIDRMTVSTIHSFCQKLLKERAFDAEQPIDARVMDESEELHIKESFFDDWYSKNINFDLYMCFQPPFA